MEVLLLKDTLFVSLLPLVSSFLCWTVNSLEDTPSPQECCGAGRAGSALGHVLSLEQCPAILT